MSVDYTTFQDSDLQVPTTAGDIDIDIAFSTPGVDTTMNGQLSLEVNPTSGNPTLEFDINGTNIYSTTFGVNSQRVVHENFAQSVLGTNNTLTVRVTGGGTVKLSDFCVLYKKV